MYEDKPSKNDNSWHEILGSENCEPARIIIENEAAISMAKYSKDTAGNWDVAMRCHYVRKGTSLNGYQFHWIGTKYQLADVLTQVSSHASSKQLWELLLHDIAISELFVFHLRGVMIL